MCGNGSLIGQACDGLDNVTRRLALSHHGSWSGLTGETDCPFARANAYFPNASERDDPFLLFVDVA